MDPNVPDFVPSTLDFHVSQSHMESTWYAWSQLSLLFIIKKKKKERKRYRTHGFKLGRGNNSVPALIKLMHIYLLTARISHNLFFIFYKKKAQSVVDPSLFCANSIFAITHTPSSLSSNNLAIWLTYKLRVRSEEIIPCINCSICYTFKIVCLFLLPSRGRSHG